MPKGNAAATASEMLSGLKSRLGFAHNEEDDFTRFDADFNDYDDFDDDGYSPRLDNEYAGYGADYDESAPVGAFRPASTRSGRFGRADSTPNLVSIDDVKARTQVPDTLLRDPLPSSSSSSSRYSSSRSLIGPSGPAPSSPAYTASLRESQTRSEGLNSLFESTASGSRVHVPSTAASERSGSSYDPYEAYSSSSPSTHAPVRGITIIKPTQYGDVEQVAKALKAGDVVVLAMAGTPDDLSKRVLDFSFGVASALDASVECPAEKVFAIARGTGLTGEEKIRLRGQGVL